MSTLVSDPEARLDYLLEHEVLVESDDGTIATTQAFQADLEVYEVSYLDVPEETFVETVASVFDLARERAAERIDETGMTRQELATFLALRSYLDDPERSRDELALMAAMVTGVQPASPVPPELTELDDANYEEYVGERGDAVVIVFKRNCAPCDVLKESLPEMTDAAPDGVSFAGIDGEDAPAFRRDYEVSVAPTTLVFSEGDLVERFEGGTPVETLVEAFATVYDGDVA